tara:strand:+ start:1794 stop:2111 length:318 start_codon:yes stop_codon:yes gene_type:complete
MWERSHVVQSQIGIMSISQKSLKKEIFQAWQDSQNEISALREEIEILQNKKNSELISPKNYYQDFSHRMEIHSTEVELLKEDILKVIDFIRRQSRKVELPAFLNK